MSTEEILPYSIACMVIGAVVVLSIELVWMIVRRVIRRRRQRQHEFINRIVRKA